MESLKKNYAELTFLQRLRLSAEQLHKNEHERTRAIFFLSGFFVFFSLIISGILGNSPTYWFLFFSFIYFWAKSNRLIIQSFNPPEELYLILFFIGGFFELKLLTLIPINAGLHFPFYVTVLHVFNLFLMIWGGGLLLSSESSGNFLPVFAYGLIFFLSHKLFFFSHPFNISFLYLFLFFGLLKRSRWLEKLTRIELGLYLILFFILYANFTYSDYFDSAKSLAQHAANGIYFYSLPKFLYYFGKIYLVVLMIRIPLVLVYNYAPISRKLWIATLFQSTIPQIIQFIVLLFIFYLFIAGWQANNLRKALNDLTRNPGKADVHMQRIAREDLFNKTNLTRIFSQNMGALFFRQDSSTAQPAYYLYFYPQFNLPKTNDSLYVVKVDDRLLSFLFHHTDFMVGTGIAAYQYSPNSLMAFLYRLKFWQAEPFRINPIGIMNPFMTQPASSAVIWSGTEGQIAKSDFYSYHNLRLIPIVVGRLFLPTGKTDQYFTLDVFYNASELLHWNFLTQFLVVLILFFFFLNSLVIRRMARFGKQINRTIVEKFAILRNGVRAIAAGNLNYHVNIHGDDEFSEFATHFNQMSKALKQFMQQAREKERMDQELKIAHRVQLKMLPEALPQIPGFEIAADLTTANEVGGDFYDVFMLDEHRYLIAIGDVSGKGMSAAFYMAQLISLLRFSTKFTTDLRDLTIRLNEYLVQNILDPNIFVTAIIGVLDIKTNRYEFLRAGHNLPFVVRPGSQPIVREIKCPGMALGMTPSQNILKKNLRRTKIVFKAGDSLVLYTDGFTEAAKKTDGQDVLYGEERFKEQLVKCAALPPGEYIECLKKDLHHFYEKAPRFDDQTIIILKKST